MNLLSELQGMLSDLSKNERRIADYILQYPKNIQNLSCEALASACAASRSTVIRLCQKLGYRGYSQFKYALQQQAELSDKAPQTFYESTLYGEDALHYYCREFLQMESLIGSQILDDTVDALSYANRVITLGYGHSAFSAQQLSFRLNKFGIDSHTLQDSTLMASYERILQQGDVVVIFSISGRKAYEAAVSEYRKNRVKVILLTMTPSCKLSQSADITVTLPHLSNVSGSYPMDDAVTYFMFIEMLIEELNNKLNRLNSQ